MQKKIVRLVIVVTRLSEKMKAITNDLDKIAEWLQDPEILALLNDKGIGVLTTEDYE